ncbi:3-hydroxyacyl-CoA dehydrogenase family protein [Arthrobacter deserti]|uniref:3-hydroxyacyl-CoA dehydrogenase family protein n=1 Tax=Arthrobacter deserti TaxID=1742687 RepID=A0ABX1JS62_9MICC|nr:3-hydroxyacyl-CoA dehydrogenase family protein [Arthrobacter deserti]
MGGGIAQVLALTGAHVALADVSGHVAQSNYERLLTESEDFSANGLFPEGATDILRETLWPAEDVEQAVRNAAVIEEAVPEVLEIKSDILSRISAAAAPDAIIGSNTSTISIGALAKAVQNPGRFLGIHFSNPAPFIPGVEIIPHEGTDASAVEAARQLVQDCGKSRAVVKDVTGFVPNRLQYALSREAVRVVEEGIATVEGVDTVVRTTFGFRLPFFGPFAIADMAGLDVYNFSYKSLQAAFPDEFAPPRILTDLVEQGRLGTKSGGGFLNIPSERIPDLAAYRNKAYVRLQKPLEELGPPPVD